MFTYFVKNSVLFQTVLRVRLYTDDFVKYRIVSGLNFLELDVNTVMCNRHYTCLVERRKLTRIY